VGQHAADCLFLRAVYVCGAAQIARAFGRLFGQNMIFALLRSFDFAGLFKAESFGCAAMRFLFGHILILRYFVFLLSTGASTMVMNLPSAKGFFSIVA
jgi:hypothetical protein